MTSLLFVSGAGCATKKYARTQAETVNQRVTQVQNEANERDATLNAKHESDFSKVSERIDTTNQKLEQVGSTAQQASSAASQAKQQADANRSKIGAMSTEMASALNFQIVDKADVNFASNKSDLTAKAKEELDQIIAKVQGAPRTMVELVGFTDPMGSDTYNLALSLRRADAVSRYMVNHNIPLVSIHAIGLGEQAAPQGLEPDEKPTTPNLTKKELNQIARRVRIRVYKAGEMSPATVAQAQP